MGIYIDPTNSSKEIWLKEHGEPVDLEFILDHVFPNKKYAILCLVDNGAFTALGVMFDKEEVKAFTFPDGRPHYFYKVSISELEKVIPNTSSMTLIRGERNR